MSGAVGTALVNVYNSDNMLSGFNIAAYGEQCMLREVKYLVDEQLVEISAWGAFVSYIIETSGSLAKLIAQRMYWCLGRELDFWKF